MVLAYMLLSQLLLVYNVSINGGTDNGVAAGNGACTCLSTHVDTSLTRNACLH